MNPKARSENLVVEDVLDEVVIYDLQRDKAHALNPLAAFVWRHCDGRNTPEQIATLVQLKFQTGDQAEEMVWMSLERLGQAHLLEAPVTEKRQVMSRRDMLKLARAVGVAAALLPVVASITAPTAAQAQTVFRRQLSGTGPNNAGYNNCTVFCTTIQGCGGWSGTGSCNSVGGGNRACNCCCTGCPTGPTNC